MPHRVVEPHLQVAGGCRDRAPRPGRRARDRRVLHEPLPTSALAHFDGTVASLSSVGEGTLREVLADS